MFPKRIKIAFRAVGWLANEVREWVVSKSRIPTKEQCLCNNKKALKDLERGMEDVRAGRIVDKGSFAKFIDNNIT